MKNVKKTLSVLLVLALACSLCVTAFAAEVVDSVGSEAADLDKFVAGETVVGQDTTQNQESEYDTIEKGDSFGDKDVMVYVTQGPTYTVMIPKVVILDGNTGIGKYTVQVKGDIEGEKQITVKPDATVTLEHEGKDDITANIAQTKTAWVYSDIDETDYTGANAKTTGTITIPDGDLTAGSWHGTFLMTIAYEDVA